MKEGVYNVGKRYNITIQYKDGGEDVFLNAQNIRTYHSIVEITESSGIKVSIIMDIITFFRVETVKWIRKEVPMIEKLIKEIKRLKTNAETLRNKMTDTGEWLTISEFSELDGQVDALTAVISYYEKHYKKGVT